ncbi:hypothetical protein [Actinophytocola sp.]|uniref:sunset domain-containing protein n=1 Tax=Actinophytocola sp. TaxID=1872138 RepID=UPI003D6A0D06
MKWFTRLFGKIKSSLMGDTATTTDATPAPDPAKVEMTEPAPAEPAKTEAPAESAKVEEPAETSSEEPAASSDSAATTSTDDAPADTSTATSADEALADPADTSPAEEEPADPAINTLDREHEAAKLPESPAAEETPAAEDTTAADDTPAAESAVAEVVDAPAAGEEGPFGPGSAKPLPGGAAPGEEFTVKGKRSSKLFHTAESPYFGRTKADVWFKTPADAENAGFAAWNHKKKAAAK